MTYDEVVDVLTAAREKQGLSQAAVARMLEKSRQAIYQWEARRRSASFDDLQAWARALKVNVSFVTYQDGDGALIEAIARLSDEETRLVNQLMVLLAAVGSRDRAAIRQYLDVMGGFYLERAEAESPQS